MAKTKETTVEKPIPYDASKMLESIPAGTKFFYADRKKVEMLKSVGKYWAAGDIIEPHVLKADYLISQGWAKEVK